MKHSSLIAALFFVLWLTARAQTADALVLKGRVHLSGTNIVAANASFAQAVAVDPNHEVANAFYAFTRLTVFPFEPAGVSFLNRLRFSLAGRDLYNWTAMPPTNGAGVPVPPNDLDSAEAAILLRNHILPAVVAAGANLARVTNTAFVLNLSRSETRLVPVSVDYGDILLLRSILHAVEFTIYSTHSWNLSTRMTNIYQLYTQDELTVERLLDEYPDLFTYATTTDLNAARLAFQKAVDRYLDASQFIRNRPANLLRLFTWDPEQEQGEREFRNTLVDLRTSLNGPVILQHATNYTIYMGRLFAVQTPLRSWLPEFRDDSIVAGTAPDSSFGGLIGGLTIAALDHFLARRFDVVTKLFEPPSGTIGFVPLSFTTITGHVYSLQYSTDLVTWTNLLEFIAPGGRSSWFDTPPEEGLPRFYRLKDLSLANRTISGQVFDACSSAPINGARVSAGGRTDTTSADGSFFLVTDEPVNSQEPFAVQVSASGYQEPTLMFYENHVSDQRLDLLPLSVTPPANDAFANRTALSGLPVVLTGTTCGATSEPGEPDFGFDGPVQSVWWSWAAPTSAEITLQPLEFHWFVDAVIYTGTFLGTLQPVSRGFGIPFEVQAGITYQIVIVSAFDLPGSYSIRLSAPPILEVQEPMDGEVQSANSLAFQATASDVDGRITKVEIHADGHLIAVLTNNPYAYLWENVPPGRYDIRVTAEDDLGTKTHERRQVTLRPINDDFSSRIFLTDDEAYIYGSDVEATIEPGEPDHAGQLSNASVWWTWTASRTGPVTITVLPERSYYEPHAVAAYTGSSLSTLNLVAASDFNWLDQSAQISFQALAGTSYHIVVDGAGEYGADTFILKITPGAAPQVVIVSPTNDSVFQIGANISVSIDATDGDDMVCRLDTYLSDIPYFAKDNLLYSFSLPPFSLILTNVPGGEYWLGASAIDSSALSSVSPLIRFRVAPPNDNFADRILLSGSSVTVTGSNRGASKEPGEPDHGGEAGGKSVWWSWVAPADGLVTVTAAISNDYAEDVSLAIYTGQDLPSLIPVVAGNYWEPIALDFLSQSGQVYHTAIDGTYGNDGNITLSIDFSSTVSLEEALDTSGLVWTSGGAAPWFGQTNISFDGVDAAQTRTLGDFEETWLQTTVTGPITLRFSWKVSSKEDFDFLEFYVDGILQRSRSGEVDWETQTNAIGPGTHVVRWRYSKDEVASQGLDRAWLDQVAVLCAPPRITSHPTNLMVVEGSSATFRVIATGTSPLSYQWKSNGVPIGGATASTYTIANVQTNHAGVYSATVTNQCGAVVSSNAALSVTRIVSLAEAVDTPTLTWTSGGNALWRGQTQTSFDGMDAAESGLITHSQQSWMQTTVTGPGTLTYRWKISSESGFDYLSLYLDGILQSGAISGEVDWQSRSNSISLGNHTIRWAYAKDSTVSRGQDRGWLDQISFVRPPEPPMILLHPTNRTAVAGTTVIFRTSASGSEPLTYQWWRDGNVISGATDTNFTITNVQTNNAGTYSVVVSNFVGIATSSNAILTVIEPLTLAYALEAPAWNWTTGGNTMWSAQTNVAHHGGDAARTGFLSHTQECWVQASMNGPGLLTYWWKVSSETNFDFLECYIDGVLQSGRISGEVDWQSRTSYLPGGSHVVRWRYVRDESVNGGQNMAWLDQITLDPLTGTAPFILTHPIGQVAPAGSTVYLGVIVAGTAPLSYQWRKNGATLADGGTISGALTSTLTISNLGNGDTGSYSVVIQNAHGTAGSQDASLTVEPYFINSDWARRVGGTNDDQVRSITGDSLGNVYLAGFFQNKAAFGPNSLASSGGFDGFLTKLDTNGNFVWSRKAGGPSNDIVASVSSDRAGNLYLAGYFSGTANFGSNSVTSVLGREDVFLAKLDENGSFLWAKRAGGTSFDFGVAVGCDNSGYAYMAGNFYGFAGFGTNSIAATGDSDVFVAKLDSNGNFLWARKCGGTNYDEATAMAVDATGNIYVTGRFRDSASYGTNVLISNGSFDAFVAALDTDGNFRWARRAGGAGFEVGNSLATDSTGNVYLAGRFDNTPEDGADAILVKWDPDGNFLWGRNAGGTNATASFVTTDAGGKVYVAGSFVGTGYFGPDVLSDTSVAGFLTRPFVTQLDANGGFLWTRKLGGGVSPRGLVLHEARYAYFAGTFNDNAYFGTNTITSIGRFDACVGRIVVDSR